MPVPENQKASWMWDVEDMEKMLDVHLKGPSNITQRAFPAITKSKGQLFDFFEHGMHLVFLISLNRKYL